MLVRRCHILRLEPRELASFDLAGLLAGGTGVSSRMQWFAHAPHLDAAVEVDVGDIELLGSLGPHDWTSAVPLRARHGSTRVQRLLRAGLLVGRGKAWTQGRLADERLREQHWHASAALLHADSRWQGVDAVRENAATGLDHAAGVRERFGAPPPAVRERRQQGRIGLPRSRGGSFDELLDARSTCRNFDTSRRMLPRAALAKMLERVFGARARVPAAAEFELLKKTSPSGGALHPTDAYLIVRRVRGVAPGLYHYDPVAHALDPMPWAGGEAGLAALARTAVAGQDYFADAHVLVVLAPRFARNFWKYRDHAKAYRVCILDAGHLSQTLFLSATEQGLGAFITAAINEVDIEQAFGLTGYVDGPLAVCGFGIRAGTMITSELDPNRKVWRTRSA
ncbi:putative peptide maturation dehydrogenase [Luteimonas sp. 8-5]|uniref:putative peptide maturation dehydrogenase n=1 Tax=Luteimonas sp. 8-5 TaxID=3039387 RepID=UPI0024370568|nr:putative peptide maturation dehydrogenase [Luteimonas sp. 8-5]MDG6348765.1 putative peptide maturation dehydrogenase [Luteimonas sp. 8-5]